MVKKHVILTVVASAFLLLGSVGLIIRGLDAKNSSSLSSSISTEDGVYLITNGGTVEKDSIIGVGKTLIIRYAQYIPTRDHSTFEGWYYDEGLTQKVPNNAEIAVEKGRQIYLYARWENEDLPGKYLCHVTGELVRIDGLVDTKTTELLIPRYIGGRKVNWIKADAFKECSTITSVTLPSEGEYIGNNAFRCTSIVEIAIPNSYTYIGRGAFAETLLETVSFAINSKIATITQSLFEGCENLASIELPNSITIIDKNAFAESGLSQLTFGSNAKLNSVAVDAFKGTPFYDAAVLEPQIELQGYLFYIKDVATLSSYQFSSTTRVVGQEVFKNAANFELVFPSTIESILSNAFANANIPSIDLSQTNITTIISDAFNSYSHSITLPSTLTRIENEAFRDSSSPLDFSNVNTDFTIGSRTFMNYHVANIDFKSRVQSIGSYSFQNAIDVTSVTGLENVHTISNFAFSGASNIAEIVLPNTLTSLGRSVFEGWTSQQTIKVMMSESEATRIFGEDWKTGCEATIIYL